MSIARCTALMMLLSAAVGCESSADIYVGMDEKCSVEFQCSADLLCLEGVCRAPCNSHQDCPAGDLACRNGICGLVPNSVCAADDECTTPGNCELAEGVRCVAGRCNYSVDEVCAEPCDQQQECPNTHYCDVSGHCRARVDDGEPCPAVGPAGCGSEYCSNGWCCQEGSCCDSPEDCPGSFTSDSMCYDTTPSTNCQGTRLIAACVNHMCETDQVNDDSGCENILRACPDLLAPVSCSSSADQPVPACAESCGSTSDCALGARCVGGVCLAALEGGRCEGGSCGPEMVCQRGICCGADGPPCCENDEHCPAGLACDPVLFSCAPDCVDGTSEGCADPENTYCLNGACVPLEPDGTDCIGGGSCASGLCECANADCTRRVCANEACGDCHYTVDGRTCDQHLVDVPCDDGVGCTLSDACLDGVCTGVPDPDSCPAPECSIGSCDPYLDCQYTFSPVGTECPPDADPCTENGCDGEGSCNVVVADSVLGSDGESTCYLLFESPMPWADAVTACEQLSPPASLAAVRDAAEQSSIAALVDPASRGPGVSEDVWLGGTDQAEHGVWLWTDDEPFTYDNWRAGEPSGVPAGPENCLTIEGDRQDLNASWSDRDCVVAHPYVCEREQ